MPRLAALVAALASVVALVLADTGASPAASSGPAAIDAQLRAAAATVRPGTPVRVSGTVAGAVGAVKLQLATPDGALRGPYGPFTVSGGRLDATLPAAATDGLQPTART